MAMTRAREKLILSVALTAGRKTLTELGEDLTLPVSPMTLSVQPSVGHWVLLYAMTRPEATLLRALAGPGHDEDFPDPEIGPRWEICWVNDLGDPGRPERPGRHRGEGGKGRPGGRGPAARPVLALSPSGPGRRAL
ncbi:MAG: hypothetical protein V8S34_08590 [Lawsonibacter sp.]